MEDGGDRRGSRSVGGVVFGSEACQVRHETSVRLQREGGNERRIAARGGIALRGLSHFWFEE
jgi:hypothetical protein